EEHRRQAPLRIDSDNSRELCRGIHKPRNVADFSGYFYFHRWIIGAWLAGGDSSGLAVGTYGDSCASLDCQSDSCAHDDSVFVVGDRLDPVAGPKDRTGERDLSRRDALQQRYGPVRYLYAHGHVLRAGTAVGSVSLLDDCSIFSCHGSVARGTERNGGTKCRTDDVACHTADHATGALGRIDLFYHC